MTPEEFAAEYQRVRGWIIRGLTPQFGEYAEDVLQEGVLLALRFLHTFNGSCSVQTWLFTIARNRGVTIWKKEGRRAYKEIKASKREHLPDLVDMDLRVADVGAALQSGLASLSKLERQALQTAMRGDGTAEAAIKRGRNPVTERVLVCNARKRLRKRFEEAGLQ